MTSDKTEFSVATPPSDSVFFPLGQVRLHGLRVHGLCSSCMACQKQSSEADEDAQKNQSLLLYVGFAVANLSYYEKNQGLAT